MRERIGEELVKSALDKGAFVYALIKSKMIIEISKNKNLKIYNGNVKNINLINKILKASVKEDKKINCLINNAGVRFRKNF